MMMSATRGPEESTERTSSVQSVDRAISILELVAARGEVGITEIAEELDVHKSTASVSSPRCRTATSSSSSASGGSTR